jgi:hypothetical protein
MTTSDGITKAAILKINVDQQNTARYISLKAVHSVMDNIGYALSQAMRIEKLR